jgi:hypothetical protein
VRCCGCTAPPPLAPPPPLKQVSITTAHVNICTQIEQEKNGANKGRQEGPEHLPNQHSTQFFHQTDAAFSLPVFYCTSNFFCNASSFTNKSSTYEESAHSLHDSHYSAHLVAAHSADTTIWHTLTHPHTHTHTYTKNPTTKAKTKGKRDAAGHEPKHQRVVHTV